MKTKEDNPIDLRNPKDYSRRDSLIAVAVTLVVTVLMVLGLIFGGLTYDERLAKASIPEIQDEEEEIFLDPELLEMNKDIGEVDAVNNDAPAAEVKGNPVPAPVEQPHTQIKGTNENPAPNIYEHITSSKESVVQTTTPSKKDEEMVASSMAGKFSSKPGAAEGKFDSTSGSGGTGSGVTGKMSGRQFLGCPLPDVSLTHKVVVTVSITVDADGKVTSATASGAADRSIRKKCEQAALQAKWSAKKGSPSTRGSITFTIIPK